MKVLEKSYSYVFKKVLKSVNPIKKRIMKAECIVHKFINTQSLIVLRNDGHMEAYKLIESFYHTKYYVLIYLFSYRLFTVQ